MGGGTRSFVQKKLCFGNENCILNKKKDAVKEEKFYVGEFLC